MTTKRQTHPWPWWRRLWREVVWGLDLDDGTGDGSPSLTKWLALVFGVLVVVAVVADLAISGTQITLAIIAISAAFGRSMWRHYLSRTSVTLSAADSTSRQLADQVAARRNVSEGYEVSK